MLGYGDDWAHSTGYGISGPAATAETRRTYTTTLLPRVALKPT